MTMTAYQSLLLDFTPRPIRSAKEYRRALSFIEQHMRPTPPKAEAELLELLSTLVADYESNNFSEPHVSSGEMLAHLIEARGVSKADVARATGISPATITSAVNDQRGISKQNAVRLAEYFHVSSAVFLATTR
jgi:HTH-type transcriptional regulator/antitoxin HigA